MTTRPWRLALVAVLALPLAACQQDTPTLRYAKGKEGGCADIFVFMGTADGREVLWVAAEKAKLKLPESGTRTFDLATKPAGLQVAIDLWEKAPLHSPYCNDIAGDEKKLATWKATAGKVTITTTAPKEPGPGMRQYKVSVVLEGVVFEEAGRKATLEKETITDANVGWLAG